MKNRILIVILIVCMALSGCRDPKEAPSSESLDTAASVSEEESAALVLAKMDAVSDALRKWTDSEGYRKADDDRKAEIVIEGLREISERGTEKYPEPLVKSDSWVYKPEAGEVEFEYFNGALGSWVFHNENDPNDPSQTIITK